MSNDKDGSGKGPAKPGSEPTPPKKPTAIIDLKASEVEVKSAGSTASGTPSGTGSASGTTSGTTSAVPPAGSKSSTAGAGAASATSSKPADASSAKPSATSPTPAAGSAKSAPAAPARGGFTSVLTHLTSGVAGGLLALLAADTVGPQLGLPSRDAGQAATASIQQKLASLEADLKARANSPAASADVAPKLAAAEKRIADLEKLAADLASVREAQAKLASQAESMGAQLAKAGDTADAQRLAKMEEALAALSAAAGTDPQKGRIPQLAVITGKLADLESSLNSQIAAIRKGVTQEVDARLASTAEAAEAAKQGTQRIDRDLGTLKADATRLGQRVDGLKTAADQVAEQVRTIEQQTAALKADMQSQLKTVARPQDVSTALAPVTTKLASLESSMQGVLKAEDDRKANAERVLLSLELGNLKRALDRGGAFAPELAAVQKIAGGKVDLSALDKYKATGVPTIADLAREFRQTAYDVIDADKSSADASVVEKLLSGAQSVVRVRKTDVSANDTSAEAVVARMEASIKAGQLAAAVTESKKLSSKSLAVAKPWLDKAQARSAAELAIASIDEQLKSSLGAKPAAKGAQ